MTTTLVLDLSSNNAGPWDFRQLHAAGIGGAIIKATEGTTYTFPGFRQAFADAKAAGLVVGAYCFARPALSLPEAEAAYFLAALPPLFEGDIVALDIEAWPQGQPGDLSAWALAWCRVVQAALAQVPLVYSYPDFINNHLTSAELAPYPLWLADLGATPRQSMPPWASVALRQYSWTGRYPGLSGDVDVSSFAGGVEGLRKLGKPVPIVPPVVTKHVRVPGSLKVAASHSSAVALDPHLHAVWCEPGVTLIPTGPAVHTDDDWLPVRLDAPERIVHGFYPVASLA